MRCGYPVVVNLSETTPPPVAAELAHLPTPEFDAAVGYIWFVRNHILVAQSVVQYGTRATVAAINDRIDELLASQGDEIASNGGLISIFDFRSLTGYEAQARNDWVERMKARKPGYLQASRLIMTPGNPIIQMAFTTLSLVGAMAGATVRPCRTVSEALEEFGL